MVTLSLHILNRLSFGPKPGDLTYLDDIGIESYIQEQLFPAKIPLPTDLQNKLALLPGLETSPLMLLKKYFFSIKKGMTREKISAIKRSRPDVLNSAIAAGMWQATESPRQLEAVLTDFWFNHFNVYPLRGNSRTYFPDYVERAIRPRVLGKFRSLLDAVVKHPALLFYLDNRLNRFFSNRPRSKQKLNENLARELLELHTLGVDGGYTQADIVALSQILSGWGIVGAKQAAAANLPASGVYFNPEHHDFSQKIFLGESIEGSGAAELDQVLDLLASHPSTARYLSFKLAQWFVADTPPPALVKDLTQRFLATDGDIRQVLSLLFDHSQFRNSDYYLKKFKPPYRFLLSMVRANGLNIRDPKKLQNWLRRSSMPLYGCVTPDGFDSLESTWLNSDGLFERLTLMEGLPHQLATPKRPKRPLQFVSTPGQLNANDLQITLNSLFSPQTQQIAKRDAPKHQPLLLLSSPEFMYF